MTQTLPDREVLTQPIAHRVLTTATYHIRQATLRPDETMILATPDRFGDLPMVPLGRLQEPPTGNPPPLPKPPPGKAETLADYLLSERTEPVPPPSAYSGERRPPRYRGARRAARDPRWAWALIGAGMTVLFAAAGIGASALMGVQW